MVIFRISADKTKGLYNSFMRIISRDNEINLGRYYEITWVSNDEIVENFEKHPAKP